MEKPIKPDLLERVRERPGMYIGSCSLTALFYWIEGYNFALTNHKIGSDSNYLLPIDFNDWVAYRLHYYESTSGWRNMILKACRDEVKGFKKFFQLLDEYKTRQVKMVARWVRNATSYSLIAYTDDPGFFIVNENDPSNFTSTGTGNGFCPGLKSFELNSEHSRLTVLDAKTYETWRRERRRTRSGSMIPIKCT